jgi:large subunit ribosomal protein L5
MRRIARLIRSVPLVNWIEGWQEMARLHELYKDKVVSELMKQFGYANVMAVPRLEKIVVNMGVGKATENKKALEDASRDLTIITSQKPFICRARKSVAGFHLRAGNEIGCKVTLRGRRMWEFLDRLVSLAIPRIRDFRGFPETSFDGNGNYTLGLTEQAVFPEINIDKNEFVQGMDVTFRFSGANDDASRELMRLLGFPFRRSSESRN